VEFTPGRKVLEKHGLILISKSFWQTFLSPERFVFDDGVAFPGPSAMAWQKEGKRG
jgi:hypothetical protein